MLTLTACSNIDCPLDNVVLMQCNLYTVETQGAWTGTESGSQAIRLTVGAVGTEDVFLSEAQKAASFLAPLKEGAETDTLLLLWTADDGRDAVDTLFVSHKPQPHFESVDCPASVFHTLTSVRATSHPLSELPLTVDSVALVRSIVNYDDIENIRIFLRSTTELR